MRSSGTGRAGLYVHVPFCRTKCVYCDFYSVTGPGLEDAWLDAVGREMELYKDRFGPFNSLYIGGGTPTCLSDGQLASLFGRIFGAFAFLPGSEITVEANPDDMGEARFRTLRSLGCNRLSIGVQSFDDGDLAFLGRRHDAAGAEAAVKAAVAEGFSNIGLDLIYGLPGQTRQRWASTLDRALSLSPAHLSCYQLTVEGRTPLSRMVAEGRACLPDEEESASFFLMTSRILRSAGFIHYEVSNFAASPKSVCRHNEKYWRHVPYLGLGPSAHSFDGRRRWWNVRCLERYIGAAKEGPVEGSETLTDGQLELERLYLGLRTSRGVRLSDLNEASRPCVRELKRAGLVRVRGDRLKPSPEGYLVADSLPALLD